MARVGIAHLLVDSERTEVMNTPVSTHPDHGEKIDLRADAR